MGKTKIDLGISTEEKPEWTISLDYAVNNVVKDDMEVQSRKQHENKGSRSIFNDALDSDFLSNDRSSFSDTQIPGEDSINLAGGLDEAIQSPGMGSSLGNEGSSDGIPGAANGAMLGGADDSLTTISLGNEGSSDGIPGAANGAMLGGADDSLTTISTGAMEQPTEGAPEILNEIQEESPDKEQDEVEEKLTHLMNSMDPWEQSENALSEAAALLSKEEKVSAAGVDSEEKKLKDLFERLDISENLNRMNAVAQEDMADVIEQTQKDNELVDAIDVGIVEPADTVVKETEPETVLDLEPQKEETVSLGEIEITNDMFDMGYDLSDEEENYSDENIDLNLFKGINEEADEFSSTENSLDLDVVEHTGQNGAELDMSNLVEAAMSDLSGSFEENIEIPVPEESTLSEAEFISGPEESALSEIEFISEPKERENILNAATPEENALSQIEFISKPKEREDILNAATPEENALSEMEFISKPKERENILNVAMQEEESVPGLGESIYQSPSVEFKTESSELEEENVQEETAEPEQIKLEFEPVYPEGQGPNLAGILNDTGDGDVASMIIEDYSEVPTVSDIETKLKKREKDKKKHKSKESQQKKIDGFAYSLEDINTKTTDHIEQTDEKMLAGREAVEAALEVAAETAVAEGASKDAQFQSEEYTASVYARHVVHKKGKIKRSYYSLFYKEQRR
ncbi:MAG: hypothetical protein HFG34_06840 [Eubacterium sp.]|nr:hypothetical protein [Eubacterium sp.]